MGIRSTIGAGCDAIDAARDELWAMQQARLAEVGPAIVEAERAELSARVSLNGARRSLEISHQLRNPDFIAAAEARVAAAELVWRRAEAALRAMTTGAAA